ncbi:MAG TPA: AAA family ATPase, partial [Polyangiales bacterium]|nr:AAA family ATPase [Polyangiales bacterium]
MQLRIPEVTLLEDRSRGVGKLFRALDDAHDCSSAPLHDRRNVAFDNDPYAASDSSRRGEAVSGLHPSLAAPNCSRAELRALEASWQRCTQSGNGVLLAVLGAAGSGKSRLLAAFSARIAEANVQVLSVRCRNRDWAPFSALKRLLDAHLAELERLEPTRRSQREANLRTAAGPMASHAKLLSSRLASLFQDAPEAMAQGDVQQFFVAGMADFLACYLELSERSLVVLDDVHWLDASSRMVLSRVAARLCPQGHVFVCAARDDAESREVLERFRAPLASDLAETVRLGPLSFEGAAQVVAESLGIEDPPLSLVEQLTQLSDGTPLSLLELLRSTLERGHLKVVAGRWQLETEQVQRMRLPASSQALIERRLAQLDPGTHDVLLTAAVLRNHVDPDLLARVTGLDPSELHLALERSAVAHLLELDAYGEYSFIHDTIWEALLAELSEEARHDLHARVAEALLELGGSGADYEYELARHCAAGMLDRDPARVFETNRNAARRALEAYDDLLALSFLKAAEEASQRAGIDPGRELY